jgi:putative RNA 2'-phosphotransferase
MSSKLRSISKFLAYLLRHGAQEYELDLDEEGFADFEQVWALVKSQYKGNVNLNDLQPILDGELDGKKRFELVDGRIRAIYGHNRNIEKVNYLPVQPPPALYHGTNHRALQDIMRDGLVPMQRQYVHLSVDLERAYSVARRRTPNPIILCVQALDAHLAGHVFYQPDENHFLCAAISPQFITHPVSTNGR